ncbi:similar to Saccharomyces cerevisiae YPR029C APL4 Gamma-adaptin, large subunit of the clathrin-associated protein (AP-1) complex [Maudiozyma saulgeensis]|uniref:AP-1 complex subunit gamma n=1 Tax=Maudiozyma saulgeensis TaxID=1789683 RepID=A0A1X7QXQ1_9SACH|nr:similar to Saccharomyces cerevisiae YPR029C APL4 Gamma-adaptin, large subunit of the clathrin-associated protein (AP-1) complex [Kazachstania saulgeensis]
MVASSLRSFIKDVRGAKTLADERSIITKQSAKIRTKLRDDHLSNEKKRVNIQKLLYLYILGEKTHFGQVESINLIASDNFVDKRLGYLATILLLDESQDLLTLLTNMLNNDLQHPNKYIVALALNTLGCLSSTELARDLYPDVENILQTSNDPYLLRKALQCNAKLIFKDRSLLEIFPLSIISSKLLENPIVCTHGVLLGVCKVLQAIFISLDNTLQKENGKGDTEDESTEQDLQQDITIIRTISDLIPQLSTRLSSLNSKNLEPAYDVQGIQDPFLQCELIVTLKWFFKIGNHLNLDEITQYNNNFNDLLTQLATNTSAAKNPGNAILYEVTKSIFELKLTQPLRVLGINILANFLTPSKNSNTGNNVKYVGLNTLIKVVPEEPASVQRYRKFISQCLYDYDISIKFRALGLTFAIMNEQNLTELTTELVKFLGEISKSHYSYVTSYIDMDDSKDLIVYTVDNLLKKFEIYSNGDEKAKLDTLLTILKISGTFIDLEKTNEFLIALNNMDDMKYKIATFSKELTQILDPKIKANTLIGNASLDLVMIWCIGEYTDLIKLDSSTDKKIVNDNSIVKYLSDLNDKYRLSHDTRMVHYILTAALKLSSKITNGQCVENLRQIIVSHSKDANLMLQTKSVQYELLFNQPDAVKKLFLQAMPKFEKKLINATSVQRHNTTISKAQNQNNDLLLDLLTDTVEKTSPSEVLKPVETKQRDIIADLLASTGNKSQHTGETSTSIPIEVVTLPSDAVSIHDGVELQVYEKTIDISPGLAHLELYIQPKNSKISDIQPLCAVPKTQKLTLSQLRPSNNLDVGKFVKQTLKITGSGKLKLRIKLSFQKDENPASESEQFDYKLDKTI